jgi:hypothetical protein
MTIQAVSRLSQHPCFGHLGLEWPPFLGVSCAAVGSQIESGIELGFSRGVAVHGVWTWVTSFNTSTLGRPTIMPYVCCAVAAAACHSIHRPSSVDDTDACAAILFQGRVWEWADGSFLTWPGSCGAFLQQL